MAAINHDVTEQELEEARLAIIAVQCQKGHTDAEARFTADNLIWLVFRNVITLDSVRKTIATRAKELFIVQKMKGQGTIG
jgi:hypothetical protein